MNAIPIEGLLGRIVGDALIHYFNLAGAYIVCATVLAVALYLTTAFSFSSVQVWVPTRLAFLFALRDRWTDWKEERQKQKLQRELEKRRSQKPVVTTQAVTRGERFEDEQRATRPVEARVAAAESGRPTGIERVMHITAGVYVNDNEDGLIEDIDKWLEGLAPFKKDYRHHQTGEDNGDSHLKALLIHHEVIVPITAGKLDFGTWQRIFYAEFDGQRDKRVIVKVMGE